MRKAAELDRCALSADRAVGIAVGQVRRAEEFQLLVLLRLARHARAGDADRHRHFPDDELQARRDQGVRLGRIHHARRRVGLAHPLHALDRRVDVLRRRVSAHVPRPHVRQLPQAARAAVDLRLPHLPVPDGRGVLRLPAPVGPDVVLGRAGDRQPVLDRAVHRRRPGRLDPRRLHDFRHHAEPLLRVPRRGAAARVAGARRRASDGAARSGLEQSRRHRDQAPAEGPGHRAFRSTASTAIRTTRSRTSSASSSSWPCSRRSCSSCPRWAATSSRPTTSSRPIRCRRPSTSRRCGTSRRTTRCCARCRRSSTRSSRACW